WSSDVCSSDLKSEANRTAQSRNLGFADTISGTSRHSDHEPFFLPPLARASQSFPPSHQRSLPRQLLPPRQRTRRPLYRRRNRLLRRLHHPRRHVVHPPRPRSRQPHQPPLPPKARPQTRSLRRLPRSLAPATKKLKLNLKPKNVDCHSDRRGNLLSLLSFRTARQAR